MANTSAGSAPVSLGVDGGRAWWWFARPPDYAWQWPDRSRTQ